MNRGLIVLLFMGAAATNGEMDNVSIAEDRAAATNGEMDNVSIAEDSLSCSSPFREVGGRCMHVDILNTGSWDTMRSHCKSIGGDLVKLNDAEVFSALVRYIHGSGIQDNNFWIGGTDEGHEGVWVWVDQELVQMGTPYWANYGCDNIQFPNGGINQNCIYLAKDAHLYFNDYGCDVEFHAICEQ